MTWGFGLLCASTLLLVVLLAASVWPINKSALNLVDPTPAATPDPGYSGRYSTPSMSLKDQEKIIENKRAREELKENLEARKYSRIAFAVLIAIWGVQMVMNTWVSVPTKNVGIVLDFGKPEAETLSNGRHWIAPWKIMVPWDNTTQTTKHESEEWGKGCTKVRLKSQSIACVNVRFLWHTEEAAVPNLYKSYKHQDKLEDAVVETALQSALNAELSKFDPTVVTESTDKGSEGTFKLVAYDPATTAVNVVAGLKTLVGDRVVIDQLSVPILHYDGATEEKIAKYTDALANFNIAKQNNKTADIEKDTAAKLNKVLTIPYVLDECLKLVEVAMQKNYQLPSNFCNFGTTSSFAVTGGKQPVP